MRSKLVLVLWRLAKITCPFGGRSGRGTGTIRAFTGQIILSSCLLTWSTAGLGQRYDLVLSGGRVMDPESALDAVRNVGIRGGRIAAISEKPLDGRTKVDVTGLLVAPG